MVHKKTRFGVEYAKKRQVRDVERSICDTDRKKGFTTNKMELRERGTPSNFYSEKTKTKKEKLGKISVK